MHTNMQQSHHKNAAFQASLAGGCACAIDSDALANAQSSQSIQSGPQLAANTAATATHSPTGDTLSHLLDAVGTSAAAAAASATTTCIGAGASNSEGTSRTSGLSVTARKERKLQLQLWGLGVLVIAAMAFYLLAFVNFKFFGFAMEIRVPKLLAMSVAAICIGASSLIFQTLINNYIVTPCLLGMNSLYLVLHTVLVFVFGMGSFIVTNKNLAFICDLALMAAVAGFVYNYLFIKTKYNVLYVLLIGTVMTTFFTSIQSTIVRTMDPNDYDALLTTLVASFSNVNVEVISLSVVLVLGLTFLMRKQLRLLNVMSLGRANAISLGVDYEQNVKRMLLYVTLLIAIATALVGPISFMGLITTNLARQMFKTYRHSYLILGSTLISLLILIAGQALIERVFVYSVPISIFITLGGGTYFLYLVLRSSK